MQRKQKTTAEVYNQYNRIFDLLCLNSSAAIERAHPETAGNRLYANNWGNAEAKKHLRNFYERNSKYHRIYEKLCRIAFVHEYPEHNASKKYRKMYNLPTNTEYNSIF